MNTIQTIATELASVDGWLNPVEGRLLYRLAARCTGRGTIVEIGSWKGKSTIWLARGSLTGRGLPVHAIDPHTGSPQHHETLGEVWTFDEFKQNIKAAGVADLVVPHVDFSTNVAHRFDQPVEMIFIDGLHEYEGVKTDFDDWFPKVIEGGWMAFHDTTCWPGVLKVVVEDVFKSPHFRKVRFASSITCAQKVAQNTAWERLENRVVLWAFLAYAWFERKVWRLTHTYLDFPVARDIVGWLRRRKHAVNR